MAFSTETNVVRFLVGNSPLKFAGPFRMRGLTSHRYPKLFSCRFCDLFPNSRLSVLWRYNQNAHNLRPKYPHFRFVGGGGGGNSEVWVLPTALPPKATSSFSRVSVAVFHTMKQNLTQMRCFLQPVHTKWWVALHTRNNEHPLTAMQTVMAATDRTDKNDADS